MRPIRVLSLFDGMSCGQIALRELGVPVSAYYASEVDKFAIRQTQLNFPETVQIGDVRNVDVDRLCEEGEIDLLLAGSPCTDLSLAGKRRGMATTTKEKVISLSQYLDLKDAGFEFAGQSYLFWEFVRIFKRLKERNPKLLFLLENVEVGKEWDAVISNTLGLKGVHINAALVSAQTRKRIYWSNIRVGERGLFGWRYTDIPQPKDRGIMLRDILDDVVDEKYYLSEKTVASLLAHKKRNEEKGNGFGAIFHEGGGKMSTVKIGGHGSDNLVKVSAGAIRGRYDENGNVVQQFEEAPENGKTNCVTTVTKDNVLLVPEKGCKRFVEIHPGECFDATWISSTTRGGRRMVDKCNCLTMQTGGLFLKYEGVEPNKHLQKNLTDVNGKAKTFLATSHRGAWANGMTLVEELYRIRKITPTETARLQSIPEWYKWQCSETQQYRLLGNGWNVEVIKHILSFLDIK